MCVVWGTTWKVIQIGLAGMPVAPEAAGHLVLPFAASQLPPVILARVLVIGGRAFAACWRNAASGEFRSNVHLGGHMTPAELDAPTAELAERAASVVGLSTCGVDLLETAGGLRVLEVNGSPGIEGLETATGRNVAGAMISSMVVDWGSC